MEPDPAARQTLHFELHLALTLQAEGLRSAWEADLLGGQPEERLHFESLAALIRYLGRLETNWPSGRGIR